MNKREIYQYLERQHIQYEVTEHKAVYNMAEMSEVQLPYPDADAKNLFIRDDKRQNYYLITLKGNKRFDIKSFRKNQNTRPLSFATEEELKKYLGLIPGAVTPLGILNDIENKVQVYIDKEFLENSGLIGVHPNDNTATVWLKTEELINIIKKHGNTVNVISI